MLESLLTESDKNNNDKDSKKAEKVKELRSKIVNSLSKQTDLKSFVGLINQILEKADSKDNASIWYAAIKTLFDGQPDEGVEEVEYSAKEANVPVSELYPTQSEIDIVNSAKWTDPKKLNEGAVKAIFTEKDFGKNFGCPVLVYNDGSKKWIIDGHHRWSQVGLLNMEGGLSCLVIDGKEKVQDFLKVTQGAIASVLANRKLNNAPAEKLPKGEAKPENNIFGQALKGDNLAKRVKEMLEEQKTGDLLVEKLKEQGVEVENVDDVAKLVTNNRDKMVENKQVPENWAAPRPVMPQTDKGGVKGEKKEPVSQDVDGTALNKIKKGVMPKLS
jgi:hypothetical protein